MTRTLKLEISENVYKELKNAISVKGLMPDNLTFSDLVLKKIIGALKDGEDSVVLKFKSEE